MRLGNDGAKPGVSRRDICNSAKKMRVVLDRNRLRPEFGDHCGHRKFDPPAQIHRTCAAFSLHHPLLDHRIGQNDGGGGAVTGDLIRLHRHFAHDLRAHVFKAVGQFDFSRDRHPVARDQRRADRAVDHRVKPLRPQRRFDGGGKTGDTASKRAAGLGAVKQHVRHG